MVYKKSNFCRCVRCCLDPRWPCSGGLRRPSTSEGARLRVNDLAGPIGLAQDVGGAAPHPRNSLVDDIEQAGRLALDLDPGDDIKPGYVQETALQPRLARRRRGCGAVSRSRGRRHDGGSKTAPRRTLSPSSIGSRGCP
jgi:hypothetical protein